MIEIREHDTAAPAPGELELVQRFMNLHEHPPGEESSHPAGTTDADFPPSRVMLERFLRQRGLLADGEAFSEADRAAAIELSAALHAKVRANRGVRMAEDEVAVLDAVSRRAGLHPHFGSDGPVLVPDGRGVDGALGRLVAIAFLADLDGSWGHLKECAAEDCRAVFYDRSKNHSGRWCSMSSCGNRAKVRAWRERRRVDERA